MIDTAELISQKDLAEKIGVTPRTLLAWERAGKMPPAVVRRNRFTRYRRADITAWIANGLVWPLDDRRPVGEASRA